MCKERYIYPCEVRPLTVDDIRPLHQLNKKMRAGEGADFQVNVYSFMMNAITELLIEGKELICISETEDSAPILFLEYPENIDDAILNHEEGTIDLPAPLTSFIETKGEVPSCGIFVLGVATRLGVGEYSNPRFGGWCFFRSTRDYQSGNPHLSPIYIKGVLTSTYLDGDFYITGRITHWRHFALKGTGRKGEPESTLVGSCDIQNVSVEGSLSIKSNLNLWNYVLKGDIAIAPSPNGYHLTPLFGANSCVVPEGEDPKSYMEETFGFTAGDTTAYDAYNVARMAHNLEALDSVMMRYCRDSVHHDTTCKCIGWELARIKEPKLYKKYVAMHDLKQQEAMRNSWRNLLSGHEVHDFIAY